MMDKPSSKLCTFPYVYTQVGLWLYGAKVILLLLQYGHYIESKTY